MWKKRLALLLIPGVVAVLHFWPYEPVNPSLYHRIRLGMTEDQISTIICKPSTDYRRSRHVGGITSPGSWEVLFTESGLPYRDLPQLVTDGKVTVRQWWGANHGIDAAFDDAGKAVGVYLVELRHQD